jgi:hypothetical protein
MIDRGEIPVIRIGARDRIAPVAPDDRLARASIYAPNIRPNSAAMVDTIRKDKGQEPAARRDRVVRLILFQGGTEE